MKIALSRASGNFDSALICGADFDIVQINRDDWGDLEQNLSQNADTVIHAASEIHTRPAEFPLKLVSSNIVSTAMLLEAIRKQKIERLIFLNSFAVYDESMHTNKDIPCAPVSLNGIDKLFNLQFPVACHGDTD